MRPHDLPDASHWPHGTRSRYVNGRCRCAPCRAANRDFARKRARAKQRGDWNGLVDAGPARAHLLALSRQHVGRRAVSAASDVSLTIISLIRSGRRRQIRARTERRILAVDASCISDRALVPAAPAWTLLNLLLKEGYPAARLARLLGYANPALQFDKHWMTARNVRRVEQLFALVGEWR